MKIIINQERLVELAADLSLYIEKGCSEVSVGIGEIDGVHFRLYAVSEEEKENCDYDVVDTLNECIRVEGGAA